MSKQQTLSLSALPAEILSQICDHLRATKITIIKTHVTKNLEKSSLPALRATSKRLYNIVTDFQNNDRLPDPRSVCSPIYGLFNASRTVFIHDYTIRRDGYSDIFFTAAQERELFQYLDMSQLWRGNPLHPVLIYQDFSWRQFIEEPVHQTTIQHVVFRGRVKSPHYNASAGEIQRGIWPRQQTDMFRRIYFDVAKLPYVKALKSWKIVLVGKERYGVGYVLGVADGVMREMGVRMRSGKHFGNKSVRCVVNICEENFDEGGDDIVRVVLLWVKAGQWKLMESEENLHVLNGYLQDWKSASPGNGWST